METAALAGPPIDEEELLTAPPPRLARAGAFLVRSPLTILGIIIVIGTLVAAIFGTWLAPHNPNIPDYSALLASPSAAHPFGTDELGRDILSRVLSGAKYSMIVSLCVLTIGVVVGATIGLIAGYFGGVVDEVLMRLTDIFLAFPALVLAIAIASTLGAGVVTTIIALGIVWWPWYARLVRGQVLAIREMAYVEAARVIGTRTPRMLVSHILPETLAPIVIQLSLDVGYAILASSSLSFIGLGAQPPTPEWGAMISDAQTYLRDGWWTATFPGVAIMVTALGFNLLGDGLRDFLDPRLS